MRRIIYCSQATKDLDLTELSALLAHSRERNGQVGVSGMLLYSSQSFLQLLDGDDAAVRDTYSRIQASNLHVNLRKLLDTEVSSPLFPSWTMGFEHVDRDRLAIELDGFTPATRYPLVNPDLISSPTVARTLLMLYAKNTLLAA